MDSPCGIGWGGRVGLGIWRLLEMVLVDCLVWALVLVLALVWIEQSSDLVVNLTSFDLNWKSCR